MPYVSDAQRKFFHTDTARKKGITTAQVEEYDKASKGLKLPEHVTKQIKRDLKARKAAM
jgi:hypothetical protein